jgi:putative ABC transport system substrate-binding protein
MIDDRARRRRRHHSGETGGLVVVPNAATIVHRELIISLAAHFHLPAVYGYRLFVTNGGLIC